MKLNEFRILGRSCMNLRQHMNKVVWLMILPIKFYKYSISPLLPNSCRHVPTCSEYAIGALKIHGI
jgi:putative component of membrane protein insertase Oxa1/YidC/SpoIIIJ protein YidD